MAKTINITTTAEGNLSYSQSGEEEIIITTPVNLWVDPTSVSFRIDSEVRSMSLSDVITINSVAFSGTLDELKTTLEGLLPTTSGGSGGSGTILQSPDETLWLIGVNDSGALQTTQVAEGTPGTLHLFSPDNTQWEVTVNNSGALITTQV
jgi:hypothetical protein